MTITNVRSKISSFLLGLVVALCSWAPLLAAQDFGVDLTTQVTIQKPAATTNFLFTERMDPWFKVPLDANGSVFQGAGHFGGGFTYTSNQTIDGNMIGDLDLLRLAFVIPDVAMDKGTMKLEFGRLLMKDPTSLILSHPADGFLLGFEYPAIKVGLQAGFTGLILRNASSITISRYDAALALAPNLEQVLGTSRLLALAQVEFPNLFLKQNLNLSFLAQQDLNADSNFNADGTDSATPGVSAKGGKLSTQYATLKLSGPMADTLFYDFFFSYGFGNTMSLVADSAATSGSSYQYKPINAFLTGLSLDLYTPDFLNGAFNFRFLAASGDTDYISSSIEGNTEANATQFIPLTSTTLGLAYSPSLSNLMVAQLGGSIKPVSILQLGLKYLAFFRPTTGALTVGGVLTGSTSPWLGQEIDITSALRISSDIGLSLSGGLFFPGIDPDGAFDPADPGNPVQYSIQFAVTIGI